RLDKIMTKTTHPEHDEELQELVSEYISIFQLKGLLVTNNLSDFVRAALVDVAKHNLAHTAKAVEEAERAARLDELRNMTFIDRDGAQRFMPFTQYRCTKDGLLLSWED